MVLVYLHMEKEASEYRRTQVGLTCPTVFVARDTMIPILHSTLLSILSNTLMVPTPPADLNPILKHLPEQHDRTRLPSQHLRRRMIRAPLSERIIRLEQLLPKSIQQIVASRSPLLTEVDRVDGVVDFYCVGVGAAGAVEFDLIVGLAIVLVAEMDELGHCGLWEGGGGWFMPG